MNTFEITRAEFDEIRQLVRSAAGITLGESKQSLVVGRLSKRLRHHGYASFREYTEHLRTRDSDGREMLEMINCITTNKTEFFREPHHFEWLKNDLIPRIRQRAKTTGERKLRIWSAGCSMGQEPYTIAMVLAEALADGGWDAKVLATDIDTNVLAHAQAGVYDEDLVDDVPEPLRRKYFEKRGDRVVVSQRLRDLVTFRRLNFVDPSWPIRAKFDVIFCRNVTIYFDREVQATLYARFAQQLHSDGFLVAGHSENLHWLSGTFAAVGNTVYRRASGASRPAPTFVQPMVDRPPPPPPEVAIQSGGLHASAEPVLVRTVLGSCVAACIYDPEARVGGMNHFMLPDGCKTDWAPLRFGTHAMEGLIERLVKLGAQRGRLRAKIFGGAHVLRGVSSARSVPEDNVAFVKRFLADARIPIQAEKVGGTLPMLVRFEAHSGRAFVRTVEGSDADAVAQREGRYREDVNSAALESEAAIAAARKSA